jgi:hypothetical protein
VYLCSASYNTILWKIPHDPNMKREFLWIAGLLAAAALAAAWSVRDAPSHASQSSSQGGQEHRLASNPAPGANDRATASDASAETSDILRHAARTLADSPPLQAKLRYRIDMFGQRISGPGRYFQAGQGTRKTRIEFEFGFSEGAVDLHQFCDGDMLYTLTSAGGESTLEFVDLRQLYRLPRQSAGDERINTWLTVGSLTGLLDQLAEHFEFGPAVPGELDSIPVVECCGRWRAAALRRLLDGQIDMRLLDDGAVEWDRLPAHLPHQVRVTLGNDERFPGFPYRIIFEQFDPAAEDGALRPVAVLELYEVKYAPWLADDMFELPSVETPPVDTTGFYEDRIRQFAR